MCNVNYATTEQTPRPKWSRNLSLEPITRVEGVYYSSRHILFFGFTVSDR